MKKNKLIIKITLTLTFLLIISCFHYLNKNLNLKERKRAVDISYLTKLAKSGNMEAQTDLGVAYGNGDGISQNYAKALYWYNKAAMQGYAQAQFNLGLYYENGWGTLSDPQQAIKWYKKAAEQGMTKAQVNLGTLYLANPNVQKNYPEAKKMAIKGCRKK
ncbi:TPA: tetratricopeptide repeat protein [Citrobacter amalonaticus]